MDDLDAALEGLESPAPALAEQQNPEATATPAPGKAGPDGGPPPISRARRGKGGRTEFEGLFVSDSSPMPKASGIDDKIAYFREKLRRAETQMNRFKEAWAIREEEMDALETSVQAEKKRADENQNGCHELQKFLEQKKGEFEEYGAKVTAAFSEHESLDKERTAKIAELEKKLEKLHKGGTETETHLRNEVEALRSAAETDKGVVEELQDGLDRARKERDELTVKVEELTERDEAAQQQLQEAFGDAANDEAKRSTIENKLRAALKKARTDGKKLKEAVDALKKKLEETTAASKKGLEKAQSGSNAQLEAANEKVEAQQKDLDTRTDLIKRLKVIAQTAKEKINERNEKIQKLEEVNRGLAAQSVDSLDEPEKSGLNHEEVRRAIKTLGLAEKSLRAVEEDHAALVEQFEEAAETRIGDAAKKLRRILTVTIKLLGGEE